MTRKWTLRYVARWLRYFFEPCGANDDLGDTPIATYSNIHAMDGKTISPDLLEGLGRSLPPEEVRVVELLSAIAWRLADLAHPRKGLIDAGFLEKEGLAQSFRGNARQAILEARTYITAGAWRRRGRHVMICSVYFQRGRTCHVFWECENDGQCIGFRIPSRTVFWIRYRFCRILGWKLIPASQPGGDHKTCQDSVPNNLS
jgi:hypothetical protein